MNPRIVGATARRVLAQLRGDRRTLALLLVVPSLLLTLTDQMFDSRQEFDRIALLLLGIFPFTMMFLVTSVAMLRERTSGTLERLLTTPLSKLDLLLGYGIAFAVAASAQAAVTCAVAYWVLGLYTPGSPGLVVLVAILGAVLGMAIGLLASAFATSEFQAVQFMPAIVMPQILLGGLFVPREQMADWLQRVSDALPMTYAIDALIEVRTTSLVTPALVRDLAVVAACALVALALAAATLRRRAGALPRRVRLALRVVPAVVVVGAAAMGAYVLGDANAVVSTADARIDGDALPIRAPVAGTLVDWDVGLGTVVRRDQVVGRIEMPGAGFGRPQMPIKAPADGTVVTASAVRGVWVAAGAELAVATDLTRVRVTARVNESDVDAVRPGGTVDVLVDAYPATPLTGTVVEVRRSTASATDPLPRDAATGQFQRTAGVVPVRIALTDGRGLALAPGMNVTVRIHRARGAG